MADIWEDLYRQHGKGQAQQPAGDVWDELYKQHGGKPEPKIIPIEQPSSPGERKFAQELQGYVDRKTLSEAPATANPVYAGVSSAANTALFNLPRNALAGISSVTSGKPFSDEYARLKAIDDAASRQYPVSTGAGTVAGAIGLGGALPVAANATRGARALLGAGTGSALGGISEFADTKDAGKALQSAAIGGLIGGAVSPVAEKVLSAPVNAAGRAFQPKPNIPTTQELEAAGHVAYNTARDAGLVIKPEAVQAASQSVVSGLKEAGYHPKLHPSLGVFIDELDALTQNPASLQSLEQVRRLARSARSSTDPDTRRVASIAIENFDDFLSGLKPSDVVMGDAKAGVAALKEARSIWSSFRKADMVDEAIETAKLRAAKKGSGGNINNDLRDEMFKILQNKKKSAAFTDSEKAQLARIVKGKAGENTLRLLGKLSPQGNGLMATIHLIGAAGSGGQTVPLAALGAGAKYLADNATKANVEKLSKMIRARGLDIDPQDVIKSVQADRLRNFFSSIGVNLDHLISEDR